MVAHGDAGALELLGGAARGDDLDAQLGEAGGEVDDPALVGDGQQGAADPDCSRLREWLPRPGGGVLGDARSIGEARVSERPRGGTPDRYAASRDRRARAWSNARRPTLTASSSAPATSSRSASSASTTTSTTPARRPRRAARSPDPEEDAAGDWEDTDDDAGGEDAEGFDDPEADGGGRGGLGARLLVHQHPARMGGIAAQPPRRHQRDRPRQQLVLDRAQGWRGPRRDRARRAARPRAGGRSGPCRPLRRRGGPSRRRP